MKNLISYKVFESSITGCKFVGIDIYATKHKFCDIKYGREILSKKDRLTLNSIFSDRSQDFFRVSNLNMNTSRVGFGWMCKEKINPLKIEVIRLKDEYYLTCIELIDDSRYYKGAGMYKSRCYLVDSLEALEDFLYDLESEQKYFSPK